ncbi:helicase-exonuclease AddAB subunit AddA [Paenibacillus radicis (ex Gao et al. 2016)]|uniref:ATP-dependent helicase/nuclease subunit A n=1 Tax=Paenibacillus radicis (ex Gao et al. 2016) TaxID=1737354 RepID=A0A917GSK8_9BACL|nr:helicase-exonuclease AddAB subunit AddA [Paenibacillus radicis (ex Gao et al. 2016)]GGG56200.1 ATP-dependent helicase/nuclease subunit A [Paenibacillus radicis (ex Gao et al. 2016)]
MEITNDVPVKPENSTWTDDQWQAIVTEGSDVLVAAAAGSGKTAVLVERIIRKISSSSDVDRLLVATFTKAAAAEMKDRIRLALEKELERQPQSEHLRRQLALMNRASITTLHSFCLDVIRRYYPLIGLDPGFRIANETESELMRIDVLDQLFEEKYEGAGDGGAFLRLADRFGGERGDEPLYRLVQQLYDFAQSHPWPAHWLRLMAASFDVTGLEGLKDSEWIASLRLDVELTLAGAESLLRQALELTKAPAGPSPYAAAFEDDLLLVSGLLETVRSSSWEHWFEPFQAIAFGKLKAMRGDEYDKALQEQAKELRDQAKKLVGSLADELFGRSAEQFAQELQELAPLMKALAELVIDFGVRYESAKREKGLLDFGDLEHYCLRILRDPASTPEQAIPSAAALEYQRQFDEILLDEYQDTNMVQEAIVSLIANSDQGNRFMVGDVKQSIYRFRLAEPGLFMQKYRTYGSIGKGNQGLRIDLARNFRSRKEVVDGVNDVFRAIMRESVAEMDYDERAELVCGASYPEPVSKGSFEVELAVIDKSSSSLQESEFEEQSADEEGEAEGESQQDSAADLQTAQLEARWIAQRIRSLLDEGFRVYDGKRRESRPLQWRDIVILLRATQQWAPIIIEELQAAGIPAYAELSSGYFDATEVETILSLLRVIDNPYQDIPLAGTLRSPLFGLNAEELALIRISAGRASYYDAVQQATVDTRLPEETRRKLMLFLERLERWRDEARQGALADLIASIYQTTGYSDFVGGLPGGTQRQANLRALHDRARQYEATSFRGLFRFLRFIERMRDSGGDLGTARALGEQEDVVRIMSIHKSKGLEFPVVFAAGLGKNFNQQDLRAAFLKHKQLGFGPKFIDPDLRISYPTLPYLAIRRRMKLEMLAEEMRILYVALTRPKEKMFLVGTVADAATKLRRWEAATDGAGRMTDFRIAAVTTYLDWLGPLASARFERLNDEDRESRAEHVRAFQWRAGVLEAAMFGVEAAAGSEPGESWGDSHDSTLQGVISLAQLDGIEQDEELRRRLEWTYDYAATAGIPAKTSVTEMKRLHAEALESMEENAFTAGLLPQLPLPVADNPEKTSGGSSGTFRLRRPRFMEEEKLTAAEKGTVSHLLMQHISLQSGTVDEAMLAETIAFMKDRKLLTAHQAETIDLEAVASFFASRLGQRLLAARWVQREVPFSCMLPANRVYPDAAGADQEPILIQGVIDCLFEDEAGLVLLDYKTDRIYMKEWERAAERHRFQLELYAEAIGAVLKRPVAECHVFFFDGGQSVKL